MSRYQDGSREQGRGPRALGDLLGELFAARGFSQIRAATELETAWEQVIGELGAAQTQVAGLRHGVVTVTVAHPTLLQDLAAFRKLELLDGLRAKLPGVKLQDLRFRIGKIERAPAVAREQPSAPSPALAPGPRPTSTPAQPRRGRGGATGSGSR